MFLLQHLNLEEHDISKLVAADNYLKSWCEEQARADVGEGLALPGPPTAVVLFPFQLFKRLNKTSKSRLNL